MRRFPSSCTSRRSSAPSPVPTRIPCRSARSTSPGGPAWRRWTMTEKTLSLRGAAAARQPGVSRRPRIHRADFSFRREPTGRPRNRPVLARQLRRVGGERLVLRRARRLPFREQWQRLGQRAGREQAETIVQRAPGFAPANRHAPGEQHVAGIEPLRHVHHRHAALAIARLDRRLDGRGPAMPRQQRGVEIQARELRHLEQRLRQDLPIRHHHDDIRLKRPHFLQRRRLANLARLEHGQPVFQRERFDRRGLQLHPPARRLIRLRDHRRH